MLKIICSTCKKDAILEVVNFLPRRRYEFICKRCGTKFVVDMEESGHQKEAESPPDKSSVGSK